MSQWSLSENPPVRGEDRRLETTVAGPKSREEKFSVCDEFIKVEWFDKEKRIGFSEHRVVSDDGTSSEPIFSIVALPEANPQININRFGIRQSPEVLDVKPNRSKVRSILRNGKIDWITSEYFEVITATDTYAFWHHSPFSNGSTLAAHRLNVCVEFPDESRVWIAEGKQIGKIHSKSETVRILDTLLPRLICNAPECKNGMNSGTFESATVMDLNLDGHDDYLDPSMGQLYSYKEAYYVMEQLSEETWRFPPRTTTEIYSTTVSPQPYLTFDGQDYFYLNQFNITKLTTPPN